MTRKTLNDAVLSRIDSCLKHMNIDEEATATTQTLDSNSEQQRVEPRDMGSHKE